MQASRPPAGNPETDAAHQGSAGGGAVAVVVVVLVAPNAFKGTLSAVAAAVAMATGVVAAWPGARVRRLPVADGGEGTAAAMVAAAGGQMHTRTVRGPLGDPVAAWFAVLSDGTAVVEMAAASGLLLVPPERRNPWVTTTYGTGELIAAALDQGCQRLIIAIGGSATHDGGAGMAQALGVRLLDAAGHDIPPGAAGIANLAAIDSTHLHPGLVSADVQVACDVDNPLSGPRGAAAVYAAQKGARPPDIAELDAALAHLGQVWRQQLHRDVTDLPGAGAAGGLGGGLVAFLGARLLPGADLVLDALRFEEHVQGADLVITGEGCTDGQTRSGKAPYAVARRAAAAGKPVIVVSGQVAPTARALAGTEVQALLGAAGPALGSGDIPDATMAAADLQWTVEQAMRLVQVGTSLKLHPRGG